MCNLRNSQAAEETIGEGEGREEMKGRVENM